MKAKQNPDLIKISYAEDYNNSDIIKITLNFLKAVEIQDIQVFKLMGENLRKDDNVFEFKCERQISKQDQNTKVEQIKKIINKTSGKLIYINEIFSEKQTIQNSINILNEKLKKAPFRLHLLSLQKCPHQFKNQQKNCQNNNIKNTIIKETLLEEEFNEQEIEFPLQCIDCEEEVYYTYSEQIQEYTLSQLIKSNNIHNKEFQIKKWYVKLNEKIQIHQDLGFCIPYIPPQSDSEDEIEEEIPHISLLSNISGKVIFLQNLDNKILTPNTIVLKIQKIICSHYELNNQNKCQICHEQIELKQSKQDNEHQTFRAISDSRKFNPQFADKLKQNAVKQLQKSEKLFLILDLDNTIIHAIIVSINKKYDQSKDIFEFCYDKSQKFVLKIRDYMQQFLEEVLEHFDIYVFTKATKNYAIEVCNYLKWRFPDLNKKYPTSFFNVDRIIAMEDYDNSSRSIAKNLNMILPNSENMMLILDDRKDVWNQYKDNVLQTKPYYYWKDDKYWYELQSKNQKKKQAQNLNNNAQKQYQQIIINKTQLYKVYQEIEIPEKMKNNTEQNNHDLQKKDRDDYIELKNTDDTYLLYTKDILIDLKKQFFQQLQEQQNLSSQTQQIDIRNIYKNYKENLLKGKKLCMSKILIGKETKLEQSYFYRTAQKLGAEIVEKVDENTQCLLTWRLPTQIQQQLQQINQENPNNTTQITEDIQNKKATSQKLLDAIKHKVPILYPEWLYYSYEYNIMLDMDIFDLQKHSPQDLKKAKYIEDNIVKAHKQGEEVLEIIKKQDKQYKLQLSLYDNEQKKLKEQQEQSLKKKQQEKNNNIENKQEEQLQEQNQDINNNNQEEQEKENKEQQKQPPIRKSSLSQNLGIIEEGDEDEEEDSD